MITLAMKVITFNNFESNNLFTRLKLTTKKRSYFGFYGDITPPLVKIHGQK